MAITVTATLEASNVPPRVRLNVSASAGETSTTITRLNPDGTTVAVRTGDGGPLALSAGSGLLYDYESPFGQAVTYSSLETPANVTSPVTVPASQPWLIHPGVPVLSIPINLRPGTLQEETYAVQRGVFQVLGRENPVVVTDGARRSPAAELVLMTQSPDELAAVKSILADTSTLLLNPSDSTWDFDACYIAVGDMKLSRWTDTVIDSYRDVILPFQVVDRPVGGSQSQRIWTSVISGYATWTAVRAAYPTWSALIAGP